MKSMKSQAFLSILNVAGLLALSGCTSMKVKMGWKVYLAKTPITSITVNLPQGPAIGPGQKSPLVVVVTQPDGKVLQTEGKGGGKVMWKDLKVTASVVAVNAKGVLTLPKDPRVSDGKVGHITVTVPSHPDLTTNLDIPLRYDLKYVANFSGSRGSDGMNGSDGTDGTSGSMGSTDPTNPSPGGNGTDGGDGGNGGDGENGGDAPPVQVKVTLKAEKHPLLQVSVSAPSQQKFYLVDTQGGSLTVNADGGSGGQGGRAGRGGHGGSGGMGTPSGNSGRDGADGRSGSDGRAGNGGSITVTYDPQVKIYLALIHLSNSGGPRPVFKEEAVAPLW